MCFHRMALALLGTKQGLTAVQQLVLVHLANFADVETGECWPSQALLAERTGLGIATIRRALRALEDGGIIETTHRVGPKGKSTNLVNVYPDFHAESSGNAIALSGRNPGEVAPAGSATYRPQRAMESIKEPIKKKEPPIVPQGDDAKFEEFWKTFPGKRKPSRATALKAFKGAIEKDGVTADYLIDRMRKGHGFLSTDDKYLPSPTVWLNQKRWEGEANPEINSVLNASSAADAFYAELEAELKESGE